MSAAQALAGALARLAELLDWKGAGEEGDRVVTYLLPNPDFPQWGRVVTLVDGEFARGSEGELLMALMEACEARGWYYSLHCVPEEGPGTGRRYVAEIGPHSASASAPALALGRALAQAIGEGEGEG